LRSKLDTPAPLRLSPRYTVLFKIRQDALNPFGRFLHVRENELVMPELIDAKEIDRKRSADLKVEGTHEDRERPLRAT
jgi:hypothetical protein